MAVEALGDLLELGAGPLAILAAKGSRQVFVIDPDHEPARAAFGANQLPALLEFRDQTDMGTGEMVNESIIGQARRTTGAAGAPERGQSLTARTQLDAAIFAGLGLVPIDAGDSCLVDTDYSMYQIDVR